MNAALSTVSVQQTDTYSRYALLLTCMGAFLVSLDTTMMFAMFGSLRQSFPLHDAASLSWILNAYTVIYAALLVPAGGLSDRYGSKRLFLLGTGLFSSASVLAALAPDPWWLVGFRVIQAAGAAILTPASLSLLLSGFAIDQRPRIISLWGATGALAAACGPSLGALMTDIAGWRYALVINVPISLAVIILGRRVLPDTGQRNGGGSLDVTGIALIVAAITLLTFSLVELRQPEWSASALLAIDLIALLCLALFAGWIHKARQPLIQPRLFRFGHYNLANLAMLFFGVAFAIMFFSAFFYLTKIWGYSLMRAGVAITPGPLMVIPTAILAGRFIRRAGPRPVLILGACIYSCSGLWYATMPGTEAHYLVHWLPGSLLGGIGVGLVLPTLTTIAVQQLPADSYAVGSAVNQAIRQIGIVLGVALTVLALGKPVIGWLDFQPLYFGYALLAILTAVIGAFLGPALSPAGSPVASSEIA